MKLAVKICGLRDPVALKAAVEGGARHIGLVFFERSPRFVTAPLAAELARQVPTGVGVVGLFVDADDAWLEHVLSEVPVDLVQLHGSETPARVAAIRAAFGIPVMKAIKVETAADVDAAAAYAGVADRLLFDAKPPAGVASLPGGNGLAFDWTLLAGRVWSRPWMLSGGLTARNLAAAVSVTGAGSVDVSSGVEDRPGHKTPALIKDFLAFAHLL